MAAHVELQNIAATTVQGVLLQYRTVYNRLKLVLLESTTWQHSRSQLVCEVWGAALDELVSFGKCGS